MSDLRGIMREIDDERRLRDSIDEDGAAWTPAKLRQLLKDHLSGDEIMVVSNREPYIHVKTDDGVEVQCPASGLVTAVEPVMRACSGTWIAHGAGSADRETVDAKAHVAVPPSDPAYTLRRIWLTQEEEEGYYYGFANEGLWPLCHIAHVRPIFRSADWKHYVTVNRRFADAVVEEARTENPVVLVQDYHFALLPRLIRDRLPHATIITFWHIPWPNPESFGICPWRQELIEGLLGSTILGFHTRYQAKNFIETADRFLETRIEHETSMISYGGVRTQVESYPISIDWPDAPSLEKSVEQCRLEIRERLGVPREAAARTRRRPARLHEGHPRALQRRRGDARAPSGDDRPLHVRADRRAVAIGARGVPELRGPRARRGVAHQPSLRASGVGPGDDRRAERHRAA